MKRFTLVFLAALVFAACGDDKSDQEKALEEMLGGKGGFPGAMGDNPDPTKMWEQMGKLELTDAMMESYVKLMEKMRGASGRPDEAMLTAYSLNWQQWGATSGAVARASMTKTRSHLEERLEKTRAKMAAATGDQKARYQQTIEALERSLANLPKITELDRKNQAVLERWMDRIDEAGRKK